MLELLFSKRHTERPDDQERHIKLLADSTEHRLDPRDKVLKSGKSGDKIPDEWIVVLDPKCNADSVLAELGLDKLVPGNDRHLRVYRHALNGFACRLTATEKRRLAHDPRIRYLEENRLVKIDKKELTTTKTDFADELPPEEIPPGIARVGGPVEFKGERKPNIAIIDSGIDLNNRDLNVTNNITFVERTKDGNDDLGHGSRCAGIAGAKKNGVGVVGISPDAEFWAVKVVDATGSGTVADVISGIDYVTQHVKKIDATNLSLGLKKEHKAFAEAINNSVEKGMVFAVAAGNNKEAAYTWCPANLKNVLTVTSMCASGERRGKGPKQTCAYDPTDTFATDFSNHDPKIKGTGNTPDIGVEIAAPGSCIRSTDVGETYTTGSGTSFSAPAAVAVLANLRVKHPDWKPAQIYAAVIQNGKSQTDPEWGFTDDPDNMNERLLHSQFPD